MPDEGSLVRWPSNRRPGFSRNPGDHLEDAARMLEAVTYEPEEQWWSDGKAPDRKMAWGSNIDASKIGD